VKWAGGKSRLVSSILERLPATIETYHEPFVGGGAVFFALASQQRFRHAVLCDVNAELVDVYRGVKGDVKSVVALLSEYRTRHSLETYYETRQIDPNTLSLTERAARLIYLNKTGYNGLYRVNRSGQFNVPFGRYKNPAICDEERLRAAARALKGVTIRVSDFETTCEQAKPGDAVYFDPPYVPLSKTASFTAYHSDVFGPDEHRRLASTFKRLSRHRVAAVLSNSDTEFTRELYDRRPFFFETVLMGRSINSKSTARGNVAEILVSNRKPRSA
jgi:DNA adenine methylase